MPNLVVFSFFSGVGILDLAFENSSYKIVFVNEHEPKFMEAYQYSRIRFQTEEPLYGYSSKNVTSYSKRKSKRRLVKMVEAEKQKGNIVGFIGGPPCPDFSVGGKNEGANGKNGRLTRTYFNLIVKCRPDFFLFENVKGLVKTEKHRKFYNEMKQKVTHSGYTISDKLINALSYAVPQYRERIIMIGFNDSTLNLLNVFNVNENKEFEFPWKRYEKYSADEIVALEWPETDIFIENIQRDFIYQVPKKLTVNYWFKHNDVENHKNQADQFSVKNGRNKMVTIREGDTKRKSFKRLHRWRYSPTAAYGNNEIHLHPFRARRLSVAEAMAIQSLPADFILPENIPLTYKFKMIGNGVPYLMALAIANTLAEVISQIVEIGGRKNEC